ncbi:MAG: hypothetical protein ACI8S6_000306 [Myxococcota bacterium]|jgi:hypothetical protein
MTRRWLLAHAAAVLGGCVGASVLRTRAVSWAPLAPEAYAELRPLGLAWQAQALSERQGIDERCWFYDEMRRECRQRHQQRCLEDARRGR